MKKLLILTALFINTLFAANLGLDYKTLRSRVLDDFKQVGLSYKMPKKLKTTGDNPNFQVGSVFFDDGSGGNITLNKNKKVASIMMMVTPTNNATVNMNRYFATTFVVSAVAGKNGNKTVGGDIIKMISKSLDAFTKNPSQPQKNKFVKNGVKYGVMVSAGMPVMIYAEPVK